MKHQIREETRPIIDTSFKLWRIICQACTVGNIPTKHMVRATSHFTTLLRKPRANLAATTKYSH